MAGSSRPTGTLTFLFTDIEGSTRLWDRDADSMRVALARHDQLLKRAIERNHGYVFKNLGDAFCAAFATAPDAVTAALEAHLSLRDEDWGGAGPIRVRMGLHTGVAEERNDDYFGPTLNRVARLQGIGHGQQTLLSQATYELVKDSLPTDVQLTDLGRIRLRDLASPEHVWQLEHPLLPREFPPLRSLDQLPSNLPAQLTSFIGREREMGEITELLGRTRLLTLTGSGGTGKTRLALQIAAEVIEQFPDGAWFVELASLPDPNLVPQTLSETLRIREVPGESILETILDSLKNKQCLLLLDNCEHLLDACAHLADTVLQGCPKVKVLATSREGLGIAGESVYRVPSLSVPDLGRTQTPQNVGDCESVRLFVERAEAANSDFTVTASNAIAVASVCHQLDGIPLAVELAAARVKAMPVEQIESRLDGRFRLLTGGSRTAQPRQQTLLALIDWSYDLLNSQERSLLARLSVFHGGWTLEAAECVCTGNGIQEIDVLDLLTSLVAKSLVIYGEEDGIARYSLLETVRQYARDQLLRLGEGEGLQTRHRDCFLALAEKAEVKLMGPEQTQWYQRLHDELENLRAGLGRSLEDAVSAPILRFCGSLCRFWEIRGLGSEGRDWCKRALEKDGAGGRSAERAMALYAAGILAGNQGEYATALALHTESLSIRREIGDRYGIGRSLHSLGLVAQRQGDFIRALALYEESLAVRTDIGERWGIATTISNIGAIAMHQGDYPLARLRFEESRAIRSEIGDRKGVSFSLGNLGLVAMYQGDLAAAKAYVAECLPIDLELGNQPGVASDLEAFASIAIKEGWAEHGATLWGAAHSLRQRINEHLPPFEQRQYSLEVDRVLQSMGEDRFSAAWARGMAMTLQQATESALTKPTAGA